MSSFCNSSPETTTINKKNYLNDDDDDDNFSSSLISDNIILHQGVRTQQDFEGDNDSTLSVLHEVKPHKKEEEEEEISINLKKKSNNNSHFLEEEEEEDQYSMKQFSGIVLSQQKDDHLPSWSSLLGFNTQLCNNEKKAQSLVRQTFNKLFFVNGNNNNDAKSSNKEYADYFQRNRLLELYTLGAGAQGSVIMVIDKVTKLSYALKKTIVQKNLNSEFIVNELEAVFQLIKHKEEEEDKGNLVEVFGIKYCEKHFISDGVDDTNNHDDDEYWILMEQGIGDLVSYLDFRKREGIAFTVDEILEMRHEIEEQIRQLNELGLYHMDIKPSNIIITKDGKLKLIDFGFIIRGSGGTVDEVSKDINQIKEYPICGTRGFWHPNLEHAFQSGKSKAMFSIAESQEYALNQVIKYAERMCGVECTVSSKENTQNRSCP